MSHDTLIHRIVRPLVRRIAPTGVTPNQLTTVRLVTGIAAAVAFAQGGGFWVDLGGVIFLVSMLFDRADGELARQTGRMSPGGHRYDLVTDCFSEAIAFIGIGIGLARDGVGTAPILLGLVAGISIAVLFWQLNVIKVVELSRYAMRRRGVVLDPDDALAVVPVLVWLDLTWPMMIAAAVITPAIAAGLGLLSRRMGEGAPKSGAVSRNSAGGR